MPISISIYEEAPITVMISNTIPFRGKGKVMTVVKGDNNQYKDAPPVTPPRSKIRKGIYVTTLSSDIITSLFPLNGFHKVYIDKRILYPLVRQILLIIRMVVVRGKLEYITDSAIKSFE